MRRTLRLEIGCRAGMPSGTLFGVLTTAVIVLCASDLTVLDGARPAVDDTARLEAGADA